MISLIIADDHVIFRQGLRRLLATQEGLVVVGEASNGAEALPLLRDLKPAVAVLDISMPSPDGLELAQIIKSERLPTQVVLLTMHHEPEQVEAALRYGVRGYVLKESAFEDLIEAVRAVWAGQKYLSPRAAESLARRQKLRGQLNTVLTRREKEVLRFIARGLTNREIAEVLNLSVKTVDTHRMHIMQKLDLHSTAELVRYALNAGLTR